MVIRDKCSLGKFWLMDAGLLDAENLPEPKEILADLRSALEQMEEIVGVPERSA